MTTPDPYELTTSSLDPCVAVELTERKTVETRQYGINAIWKLEDGGQRIDALQVASSLQPDGGRQPIRFCFAPDGTRTSVEQSISIEYRSEYIETVTSGAGQPCMVLDVDGRFTTALDAGGCPSQPIDAGACLSLDAGDDAPADASPADAYHAATHTPAAAACSVGGGPGARDVGGFALVMVTAAIVAIVVRKRAHTAPTA
jgi:hypothetical protein